MRAFDSLEQRMVRAERQTVSQSQRASRERVQVTKKEVDAREKDYHKLVKDAERWEKELSREAARAGKERERAAEQFAAKESSAEKRIAQDRERYTREATRDRERAARDRERIATQEAKTEERIFRQSLRERANLDHQAQMQRQATRQRRAQYASTISGAIGSGTGRVVNTALTLGGAALAIGGGFSIADSLRNEMQFKEASVQASNAAFVEGDATRTRAAASPEKIMALARHVEKATNFDKTDLANYIHEYVGNASDFAGISTPSKATGRSNLEEFAMMARGSGGDLGQYVRAAAAMKAAKPEMSQDELLQNMRGIIGGGKKGNLPLEQLAANVGTITETAGFYGGDVRINQQKLLGLAQLVGPATGGDAAETATAVKHLGEDVMRKGHKKGMPLKDIYVGGNPAKGLLGPEELLPNVFKATKGRADLAQEILGERGMKVFAALTDTYRGAEAQQKGSGYGAVKSKVIDFEQSSYAESNVGADFSRVMAEDSQKLSAAMIHLEEVIAEKGTPILERWIDALSKNPDKIEHFVDGIAKATDYLIENPWKGLGAIVAASISRDLAAAGIGAAVRGVLTALLNSQAAGTVAGVVSGAAGRAGAALTTAGGVAAGAVAPRVAGAARAGSALAAPIAAGVLAVVAGDDVIARGKGGAYAGEDQAQKDLTSLRVLRRDIEEGTAKPEELSSRVREIQARISQAKDNTGPMAALGAGAAALSPLPGQRGQVEDYNKQSQYLDHLDDLVRALKRAKDTLDQFSNSAGASTAGGGSADFNMSRHLPPNQQRPGHDHG
ncbi:MAG TPA: hypothetical protein VGI39_39005 [Polyangiaceae bacterium]